MESVLRLKPPGPPGDVYVPNFHRRLRQSKPVALATTSTLVAGGLNRRRKPGNSIHWVSSNATTLSYVKIWIHAVWATHNRADCLTDAIVTAFCEHIKQNAADKGFFIDTINGYRDHMHVLMVLKSDNSIARQMQLIKGESSKWAKESGLLSADFAWESQYFAASVSGRAVPVVREYIKNQQAHHASVTFAAEFDHLIRSAGYTTDPPYGDELR